MGYIATSKKRGVTILEWLLLFAAVGVMVGIGWMGQQRFELYMAAKSAKKNLGEIEIALQSLEKGGNFEKGDRVTFEDYRSYLPRQRGNLWKRNEDPLGNRFGEQVIGQKPTLPRASYRIFQSVVEDDFWKPYPVGGD